MSSQGRAELGLSECCQCPPKKVLILIFMYCDRIGLNAANWTIRLAKLTGPEIGQRLVTLDQVIGEQETIIGEQGRLQIGVSARGALE